MRVLLLAVMLVLLIPAAQARDAPADYNVDVEVSKNGVSAEADVWTKPPRNCMDCDTVAVGGGADAGRNGAGFDAYACRGGFFYFCVVDESVRLW